MKSYSLNKSVFVYIRFFSLFLLISCSQGGNLESDANALAELQCRALRLTQKAQEGDVSSLQEGLNLAKDAAELANKFKKKYTSEQDTTQFSEVYLRELKKCQ